MTIDKTFAVLTSKLLPIIFFLIAFIMSPMQGLFAITDYVFLGPFYKKLAFYNGWGSVRPYYDNAPLSIETNGMPSGHTGTAFLLASMNGFPPSLTILAAITALQRYYIGVHSPSQIIVGGAIGCASGYAFNYVKENKEKIKSYILGKN